MKYWLWINGQHEGPFDLQEIRVKLASGLIAPDTLCHPVQGPGDWGPVFSLSGVTTPAPKQAQAPAAVTVKVPTATATASGPAPAPGPTAPQNISTIHAPGSPPPLPLTAPYKPVSESSVAGAFATIAALEFIAAPLVGFYIGTNGNPPLGLGIFLGGMLNALFLLAFARIIAYLHEIAERSREIESLLKKTP